jgi:aspartate-semialdehyde dehydrogenase
MSREEWKGDAELNKMLGRPAARRIPVESICVRIGAMRCHSQALTIKLRRNVDLERIEELLAGANPWVKVIPNNKERATRRCLPRRSPGPWPYR